MLKGARQQQNRGALQRGLLLDRPAQLETVFSRHRHISDHQVGDFLQGFLKGTVPILRHQQLVLIFRGKDDADDFLYGDTIVGQQQFLFHACLLVPPASGGLRQKTLGHFDR